MNSYTMHMHYVFVFAVLVALVFQDTQAGTVKSIKSAVPKTIAGTDLDTDDGVSDTNDHLKPQTQVNDVSDSADDLQAMVQRLVDDILVDYEKRLSSIETTGITQTKQLDNLMVQSYQTQALLDATSVNSAIECYTKENGIDYRGTVSTTIYNRSCQRWTDQQPHTHSFNDDIYQYAGLGNHNYCRNPDGANRPWCFTTDSAYRIEYCDIGPVQESCDRDIHVQGASTYIRYGRSTCPETAEWVYNGFVGGSLYSSDGGGTQYLCMPPEPIYADVQEGVSSTFAHVYHAVYREPIGSLAHLNNQDPPCAVCRVPKRSTVLMVPATTACPDETWTEEYHGYLMTERSYDGRRNMEYVCIDSESEPLPNTVDIVAGSYMFPVESRCSTGGSMPCGPYIDGYELTCVVCTK